MAKQSTDVEVNIKPKGLAKLRSQWLEFGGELIEPVALLAAGASKVEAAWAGVRGMFLGRVLGPLGLVAGASVGLIATLKVMTARWKEMGMQGASSLERMELRFRPLLATMVLAKQRVKELYDFTAKTPFRLGEVAEANQLLQSLTQGALSGRQGMELVGDSAARAGEEFSNTARMVGRLYDGLLNGRPVGEASMRLQEMSLISGETRNKIESMQQANVNGLQIWREVEKELERNKGAMDELSRSLEGYQSTYEDVQMQMSAGFSKGFLQGEKASIKATITAMEKFTPVAEYFGRFFGEGSNQIEKWKAKLVEGTTSVKGFEKVMIGAGLAALTFLSGIVVASGAMIAKFVIGAISATAASAQLAKATGDVAKAEMVEAQVSRRLTVAKAQLAAAKNAVASGSAREALGSARVAAAQTAAAARTNALATSHLLLRGAFKGVAGALRLVLTTLRATMIALVANPWFLVSTAVIGASVALWHFSQRAKQAREEMESYRRATDAMANSLSAQERGLKTVTDLQQLENRLVRELAAGYRDLEKAKLDGKSEQEGLARDRVARLEDQYGRVRGRGLGTLEKDKNRVELDDFLRERERDARMNREDFLARDPDQRARLAGRRLDEAMRKQGVAQADLDGQRATERARDEARRGGNDRAIERAQLEQKRAEIEERVAKLRRDSSPDQGAAAAAKLGQAANMAQEIREIDKALQALRQQEAGEDLQLGLASESEIVRLRTQVALYDSLTAATKALGTAQDALAEADDNNRSNREEALRKAREEVDVLQKLDQQYGKVSNGRERQDAVRRADLLEGRRKEALDPTKVQEARQKAADAETELQERRLQHEAAVGAIRLRGLEAEQMGIDIEQRKLSLALERGKISAEEYQRGRDLIAARQSQLNRERNDRVAGLANRFREGRFRNEAEQARRGGDPERARKLQDAADRVRLEEVKRQAKRESEGVSKDPAARQRYVDAVVKAEEKSIRDGRREERAERALSRREAVAKLEQDEAKLQAAALRSSGRGDRAWMVEEEAAKRGDRVKRDRLRKRFLEEGFTDQQAGDMADRQVKVDEANRLLGRYSASGTVVANSLAVMGGGGGLGVSGRDPDTALLERIEKLLEEIRDKTPDEVDFPVEE